MNLESIFNTPNAAFPETKWQLFYSLSEHCPAKRRCDRGHRQVCSPCIKRSSHERWYIYSWISSVHSLLLRICLSPTPLYICALPSSCPCMFIIVVLINVQLRNTAVKYNLLAKNIIIGNRIIGHRCGHLVSP